MPSSDHFICNVQSSAILPFLVNTRDGFWRSLARFSSGSDHDASVPGMPPKFPASEQPSTAVEVLPEAPIKYPTTDPAIPQMPSDGNHLLGVLIPCQEPVVPRPLTAAQRLGPIAMADSSEPNRQIVSRTADHRHAAGRGKRLTSSQTGLPYCPKFFRLCISVVQAGLCRPIHNPCHQSISPRAIAYRAAEYFLNNRTAHSPPTFEES